MITALSSLLSFALGALLTAIVAGFGGVPAAMLGATCCALIAIIGVLGYVVELRERAGQ